MIAEIRGKPWGAGALVALASLPVHLALPHERSVELAALLIAMIAGVYIGFAVRRGGDRAFKIELFGALAFTGAALAGLWVTPWIIPALYIAHAFWDIAHRHGPAAALLPGWYVPFCAVVDVVAGLGLTAVWFLA